MPAFQVVKMTGNRYGRSSIPGQSVNKITEIQVSVSYEEDFKPVLDCQVSLQLLITYLEYFQPPLFKIK